MSPDAALVCFSSISCIFIVVAQAKPLFKDTIRLVPPLVITEEQLADCIRIFKDTVLSFDK